MTDNYMLEVQFSVVQEAKRIRDWLEHQEIMYGGSCGLKDIRGIGF